MNVEMSTADAMGMYWNSGYADGGVRREMVHNVTAQCTMAASRAAVPLAGPVWSPAWAEGDPTVVFTLMPPRHNALHYINAIPCIYRSLICLCIIGN